MATSQKKPAAPRKPMATAPAADTSAAAEDLAVARAQFQAISKSMAVIEFAPDGTVLTCNDLFLSAMGYAREEVVGRHHSMFVSAAHASSPAYAEFWASLRRGELHSAEVERFGKGGRTVWLSATYSPITDAAGKTVKVIKLATDFTKAHVAQEEVARVRAAVDGSSVGYMIANQDFKIVYVNNALLEIFRRHQAVMEKVMPGFRADAILGSSIDRFHANPAHQQGMLKGLRGVHREQIRLGPCVFDLVANRALNAAGETLGFSVEWGDVTEITAVKQNVEQVLKAAAQGDLSSRLPAEMFTGFLKEIGPALNAFMEATSDSLRTVMVAVEQVGQAGTQLRTTSQMMSSSSVQLNRAAVESSDSLGKAAQMVKDQRGERRHGQPAGLPDRRRRPGRPGAHGGDDRRHGGHQRRRAADCQDHQGH